MDLEKKFLLWLFTLLAVCAFGYHLFWTRSTSAFEAVALVAASSALALATAHYLLFKPIRQLVVVARALRAGDFSRRLGLTRRDEIGTLASELDTISIQLDAARIAAEQHITALEQLRHADRVTTLGRLASSVAHELGNPLNVIELRAQLITSGDASTLLLAQHSAAVILEQTRRMTRIIDEILSFARMQSPKIAPLDLASVLRDAISLSEHTSRKHRTSIVLEVPQTLEVDGDAEKLMQIIVNLVMNGMQSMPNGGTLRVRTTDELRAPFEDPDGQPRAYVCIEVSDQGVGISEQHIAKVFDPFFSTRNGQGGTGLGLSVAQGIAREHEGWISAKSELGLGSSFKVHLPKRGSRNVDAHGS